MTPSRYRRNPLRLPSACRPCYNGARSRYDARIAAARFGLRALWPVALLARALFREEPARALLAGLGGHSFLPLEAPLSAAPTLVLGALGHSVGWPIPAGGAQTVADALEASLRAYGGEIRTGCRVEHIDELPAAAASLFDVTPRQLIAIVGERLPAGYRRRLECFRPGPGVFKLDYALDSPVPWTNSDCARAATVHLGGTLEEIAASERAPGGGLHTERPYVLTAQPSLFDPARAPAGRHTLWAYCHVPTGSTRDMTATIENQIERFAPGFRDRVLARSAMGCAEMEAWNANLIGGDISGGLPDWRQLLTRPTVSLHPHRTPAPGIYLCSSSTPPGRRPRDVRRACRPGNPQRRAVMAAPKRGMCLGLMALSCHLLSRKRDSLRLNSHGGA